MDPVKKSQIQEIAKRYKHHYVTAFSAQMAFFLFLSVFPLIIFILSLASRLNLNTDILFENLQSALPPDISELVLTLINSYFVHNSLSLLSASGLVALWSASRGVNALTRAFNMAYGYRETRNFIKLKFTGMFYTLIIVISIIATLALPAIGQGFFDFVSRFIPIPHYIISFFYFIRLLLNIAVYVFFILSIHKVLPAGHLKYSDTLYGSLFSIIGWFLLTKAFSFFVRTFTDYAVFYGSLASIVTLMMWLYFMSTVMMLGAEINSVIMAYKKNAPPFDIKNDD
jgi:membrane protein